MTLREDNNKIIDQPNWIYVLKGTLHVNRSDESTHLSPWQSQEYQQNYVKH